ncbi:MAG: hypothetical protein JNM13_03660 [Hyphomicrobiaceae bacterium]|nr:hypothetical protein [Hyphomicrobiaceae bacterium]
MRFHLALLAASALIATSFASVAMADQAGTTPTGQATQTGQRAATNTPSGIGPSGNGPREPTTPQVIYPQPAPRVVAPVAVAQASGGCSSLMCPKFVLLGTGF